MGEKLSATAAFEQMLDDNRRQFDALYTGGGGRAASAAREARTPAASASPAPGAVLAVQAGDREPDAIRFLNDRYADGWRHEFSDHRREGGEVIVKCKLIIESLDVCKTHFGSAPLGPGPAGVAGSGTVGGIPFNFDGGATRSRSGSEGAEATAYREAERNALANCVNLL